MGTRRQIVVRIAAVVVGIVLALFAGMIISVVARGGSIELFPQIRASALAIVAFLAGLALIGWAILPPKRKN